MKKLILLAFLAGCTTAPVVMVHPETGKTAQCGPYDGRPLNSTASAFRESQCIDDYKEQGFIRQ